MHTYTVIHCDAPRPGEKIGRTPPKVEEVKAWNAQYALHRHDGRNLTAEEKAERANRAK